MPHLRPAEWINLVAFSSFSVLAWGRRGLDRPRCAVITGIGAAGLALTILAALVLPRVVSPLAASAVRDWIPCLLMLMFYWQAGRFVTRSDIAVEAFLERWDRRLVAPVLEWCGTHPHARWIVAYLETSYMFCYVAIPLGLGVLYWRHAEDASHFWTAVLLAAYASYGTLPFIQTRPPRALAENWWPPPHSSRLRSVNLWILRHCSIRVNTIPSGHVASTTACALILLRFTPAWVGLIFLWIAISVAAGAVAGRYHYAMDAVLGALVAFAAFFLDSQSA